MSNLASKLISTQQLSLLQTDNDKTKGSPVRLLCLAWIFLFFQLVFRTADAAETASNTYQSLLGETARDIDAQFQQFQNSKSQLSKRLVEVFDLSGRLETINGQLWDKKTPEEKKSILEKERDELDSKVEAEISDLLNTMPVPMLCFFSELKRFQKTHSKTKKISEAQLSLILGKVNRNSVIDSGTSPLTLSCFKQDLLQDKSCIEKMIRSCRGTFGSSAGKLKVVYLDENVARQEIEFEGITQARAYLLEKERDKNSKSERMLKSFHDMLLGACGTIAGERYQFSKSDVDFAKYPSPAWLLGLVYGFTQSPEGFEKSCLHADSARRTNLRATQGASDISDDLKKRFANAIKTLDNGCKNVINSYCAHFEVLANGSVARHYVTQGCDVRVVTVEDVKRDISDWRQSGANTEADAVKHAEIIGEIQFCEKALAAGFSWFFEAPQAKGCKKKPRK